MFDSSEKHLNYVGQLTHGRSQEFELELGQRIQRAASTRELRDALRESEERYLLFRQLANTIPHIAWITFPDGRVEYFNQRWTTYSGMTLEESRDWGWQKAVHTDDRERLRVAWREAVLNGTSCLVEYRLKRYDGEYRWHLGISEPVRDESRNLIKWVGTSSDITERKLAEQVQAARFQHEHLIATQLQEALQPELPESAQGLALAKFYQSALSESDVGGDFLDAFPAGPEITYLVVGDLSGKGVAAAAQVATVRNMLRYALYNGRTLAGPVTRLNQTLAENNLLTGFATLFVGRYDNKSHTLVYVNCGQEPALLRRENGSIEHLGPSGSVLGAVADAQYQEKMVELAAGDALSIFTDGFTEAGPDRSDFLGVDGMARLLKQYRYGEQDTDEKEATFLSAYLVDGAEAFAQNGVHDDMTLLTVIVKSQA